MPHDSTGRIVKAGDVVTIRATVREVQPHADACNCTVLLENGIGDPVPLSAINTKALTVVESDE